MASRSRRHLDEVPPADSADPRDPYRMLAAVVAAVEADADVETLLDPGLDLNVLRSQVESDPTADALLDANGSRPTTGVPTPVIDLQGDTVVIDLRDPPERSQPAIIDLRDAPAIAEREEAAAGPVVRRRPPGPDTALGVVLNRARYKVLGLQAVTTVPGNGAALAELAGLSGRVPTPAVADLIRQAVEARSS